MSDTTGKHVSEFLPELLAHLSDPKFRVSLIADAKLTRGSVSYGTEFIRWLVAEAKATASANEEIARLREALGKIAASKAQSVIPWTHEAAADEFSRLLSGHRYIAHTALQSSEGKP